MADIRPRPPVLRGCTFRQPTPVGTAFVTLNVGDDGQPFEVFLNVGKAGSDVRADAEAMGRLISLILRLPSPLPPRERLKMIVAQLRDIGGGRSWGFGPRRVQSVPDAVAKILAAYLGDGEEDDGERA